MRFFNRVTLPTPESVELEFTLAGIGNRAVALLIDYHVLGAILVAFWILWLLFSLQLMEYLSQLGGNYSSVPVWLLAIFLLINFAIFVGYFIYFEVFWQGQTPGKRFAKIRVIREDGRPVGLAQASLRSLLRPIDDLFFIGVFLIILGKKEKRIGDMAAGTLVIQENRPSVKANLAISEAAQKLATELPHISNLSSLLPDDFSVIREYLRRRSSLANKPKVDLSLKLAREIKAIIQLETVPPGITSDEFLEAVYWAYQQQAPTPEGSHNSDFQ